MYGRSESCRVGRLTPWRQQANLLVVRWGFWVRWFANATDLTFSDVCNLLFEWALAKWSYLTKHMSISVVNKHTFEVDLSKIQSRQTGFSLNMLNQVKNFDIILNLGQHIAARAKKITCSLSFQNLCQRLKHSILGIPNDVTFYFIMYPKCYLSTPLSKCNIMLCNIHSTALHIPMTQ